MSAGQLAELHAEMAACRLCLAAGYEIYPRAIFSGSTDARIMTIGQAPGVTEKEAGRPFNAGSGTRLFAWLAQAGIEEGWFRSTQYMTSVTKCFPGKAASGGGDRVPSRQEQALCQPFLARELALVDPRLVIPIGRLAIDLFFPARKKLAEIIGSEMEHQGRVVIPLPHPSGASRWPQNPDNQALIARALARIKTWYEILYP